MPPSLLGLSLLSLASLCSPLKQHLDKLQKPQPPKKPHRVAITNKQTAKNAPGAKHAFAQANKRPNSPPYQVTRGKWDAHAPSSRVNSNSEQESANGTPTRIMLFIDGTWLYYAIHGRDDGCAIRKEFGDAWELTHHVDWAAIPQLVAEHIEAELRSRQPNAPISVEVTQSHVYSSLRVGHHVLELRRRMFDQMAALYFDVHLGTYSSSGNREKCVDIALAVDMLHFAMIDGTYDIAVLVSGDADFVPALMRTRQRGKRVAIATFRASASASFEAAEMAALAGEYTGQFKDFDVLYLDDHLNKLITRIHPSLLRQAPAMLEWLQSSIVDFALEATKDGGLLKESELRNHLEKIALGERSALVFIEHECGSVGEFMRDRLPNIAFIRENPSRDAASSSETQNVEVRNEEIWDEEEIGDEDEWTEMDEVEFQDGADMLTPEEIAEAMGVGRKVGMSEQPERIESATDASPTKDDSDILSLAGDDDDDGQDSIGGLDVAILAAEGLLPPT